MLQHISWGQFFGFAGVAGALYYAGIFIIYYRTEMTGLLNGERRMSPAAVPATKQPTSSPTIPGVAAPIVLAPPQVPLFSAVHELMEDLKPIFSMSKDEGFTKPDLLTALQLRLRDYVCLKDTEFEDAVIHHVIMESNVQCGIALHAGEVQNIWQ